MSDKAKSAGILAVLHVVRYAPANAPVYILSIFNAVRLGICGYVLLCKAVPHENKPARCAIKSLGHEALRFWIWLTP